MNCAKIENGIVTNIVVIAPWNLPEFPNAIAIDDRPVSVGDEYHDGAFWRDGVKILSKIELAQSETTELMQLLGDVTQKEYLKAMEEIENV